MKKNSILIASICIILAAVAADIFSIKATTPAPVQIQSIPEVPSEQDQTPVALPVFTWTFEKDSSLNPDGMQQTNVMLAAKYSDGVIQKKSIQIVPGGCSELPDKDTDSVATAAQVQCYYAGLGYVFKVVKGDHSYIVERKTFEEGQPNVTSPKSTYETVTEFPLTSK